MRLTQQTNYAVRALMYCAVNPDKPSRVAEIAASFEMSETHLFKIMKVLVDANLIKTIRGRNGGVMLARPADQISVGEVVRAAEGSFLLAECFDSGSKDCPLIMSCGFNGLLHEALEAFMEVLDGRSIADLSEDRFGMRTLLNIDPGEQPVAANA
ncbi:Rrf2 family transcriptional regulator [Roseibium sp.]|uniref:Rrf2 family transcriptional regulator n=1 Tax=Roseibium sp. TaxID=1936156 RepID=UPI003B51CB2D